MGKCVNSVVVNAPVDKVWATIRNFHDMSWATGVVEKCAVVGERTGDQVGAKRVLNDAFHETMIGLNDLDHTIQYSIDDGPGPVAKDAVRNYVGRVQLSPVNDQRLRRTCCGRLRTTRRTTLPSVSCAIRSTRRCSTRSPSTWRSGARGPRLLHDRR